MSRATEGLLAPSERERILRAAAELCGERGFEELSVEQICARAGSDGRAFAKLFDDVEDCLVAAVHALAAEVLSEVSRTYSADRSEWDSGLLGMRAILELMAAHPSFAYLGFIASRQSASPRVREAYQPGVQMLAMMTERLWEYSALETQPRRAARAGLGGCEALVRAELLAGRARELPRLLPELAYAATVPFLGQEEAMRLARRARELLAGSEWG